MDDGQTRNTAVEDVEHEVCLSAGAGSGKTTVLIDRLIYLLTRGQASLDQIVAVTFTEKAAAELKSRLSSALREKRDALPEPELWKYDLGRAYIGTIHSFCTMLLREHAIEANVDPAFTVLDEVGADALSRRIYHAWMNDMLTAAQDGQGMLAPLLEAMDLSYAREMLLELMRSPLQTAALIARYHEQDGSGDSQEHAAARDALLAAGQDLTARWRSGLDERGCVDFDGLLSRARDLLRDHPRVRSHYQTQFRYVHLDEFQDVDPVQADLVRLLCGFEGGSEDAPRPKMFIVGDPQQSIYRFRGADVDQFARMERAIVGRGGLSLRLTRCFRSQDRLVGFFNHTFSRLFASRADLPDESPVTYAAIEGVRPEDATAPAVEFLFTPCVSTAAESRAAEADALARRIRQLLDGDERAVTERGGDTETRRRAKPGDIAILFRAMTDVRIYETALRQYGIPFYTVAGSGFFERQEVMDVLNVLRLLIHPRDALMLAAVLRSPWVGCSDATLYWIAQDGAWEELESQDLHLKLDPQEAERLDTFRSWFDPLHQHRDRYSVAELITELLHRTFYRAVMATRPDGEQTMANIRKLLDLARQFDAGQQASLGDFVTHLEGRLENAPREAEAALEVETGNTVKLMSIHQAKGLEWPVVAVVDLDRTFRIAQGNLLCDPAVGLGMKLRNEKLTMEAGPEYERVKEVLDRLELAEQQRVLYVAATRARDRLVLSGSYDPKKLKPDAKAKDSWLKWLALIYPIAGGDTIYPMNGREMPVRVQHPPEAGRHGAETGMTYPQLIEVIQSADTQTSADHQDWRRQLVPPPLDASGVRMAVTDLETFAVCPRRYQLRRLLQLPEEAVSSELSEAEPQEPDTTPALSVGALVHEVLRELPGEIAPEELPDLVQLIERRRALEDPDVTSETQRTAVEILERWLASPTWQTVRDSPERQAEIPFLLRMRDGTSLTGRFDLLYLDHEDLWHVVDYKTDRTDGTASGHVQNFYDIQQQAYGLAAVRVLHECFAGVELDFLRTGEEVKWTPTPAAVQEAERRLGEAAKSCASAIQSDNFPKTEDLQRCLRCGYRATCRR